MNSNAETTTVPDSVASAEPSARLTDLVLAATVALSAWLIFQVQPMIAKRILPWFGGGTAVWTTVMLFFQSALFLGYLYAHLTTTRLRPSRQVRFHVALLALAALLAAIAGVLPSDEWRPTDNSRPALHILVMLAAAVGLPYLTLAATAPLSQVWFARLHLGRSPYRLYALSNAGSLAALVSYPFLIEPTVGVAAQGVVWSSLFIGFALLCAWSGLASLRGAAEIAPVKQVDSAPIDEPTGQRRPFERFFWIALPATASAALLAITNHLCQDVLSVPLLWIAPMVIYLLSFILTFDSDRWYRRDVWLPLGALVSFVAAFAWYQQETVELPTLLTVDLALTAAICMICHGELVRRRPEPRRLTSFYLSIAAGGAIGGLLVAVAAPLLLNDYYELQLSVLAVWLLALAALVTDRLSPFFDGGKGRAFKSLLGMVGLFAALCIVMYSQIARQQTGVMGQGRNFFGVLKVRYVRADSGDEYFDIANGRITHGGQFLAPSNRRVPMMYYHADSGIGKALINHDPAHPRRIGIIGLGAGTIAAYAEPNETFRFYDINPQVFDFAAEHFSYLEDARGRGATIELIEGDARLTLESEPPQNFDVLVLDAFNSDSIPAHLLTMEAFELYLKHLQDPKGVLAVHISSDHLNLAPVVQAAAERFKLDAIVIEVPADDTPATSACVWVLLTRTAGVLSDQEVGVRLGDYLQGRPTVTWTDDYSSLLNVLE